MRANRDKGVALITVMLVLILVSAIVVGMSWMIMTDQRLGGNNQDRQRAFYGAEAGMEKLTADTGTLFGTKGSLTAADLPGLVATPPPVSGIQFKDASGVSTYQILCGSPAVTPCLPVAANATILAPSAYAGMQALITGLQLTVAAQTSAGSEVKLNRQVQVVAIPVFQFGIFSESDLSFFNGPPFDFGGRVHTNGNLWITSNRGPLYLADKITVVGEVIRDNLENGQPLGATIQPGDQYDGPVTIARAPNPAVLPAGPTYTDANWRAIAQTEGSIAGPSDWFGNLLGTANNGGPAPGVWTLTWEAYGGMLKNHVKPLNLTTTALGSASAPISLIHRPALGAPLTNPQQYFLQASLRILLDDYGAGGVCATSDMMGLTGIDATKPPKDLAGLATIAQSGAVQGGAAYNAVNGYWISNPAALPRNPTITGCIKVEYQNAAGNFLDITPTILGLGIRGKNIYPNSGGPFGTNLLPLPVPVLNNTQYSNYFSPNVAANQCPNPDAGAIIHIEHVRDNPSTAALANKYCGAAPFLQTDYWPNVLFDAREASSRVEDANNWPTNAGAPLLITAAGVMNYIELDAGVLANWLNLNQGALGINNTTGFTVYFSDRRTERLDPNAANTRTGSYGYNDFVNPGDPATGCPNGTMDLAGEDIESDGILRVYGGVETPPPNVFAGLLGANTVLKANPNFCSLSGNAKPEAAYVNIQEARENPPVFFRRALKIVNGAVLNLGTSCFGVVPNPPCGLTIASENPVYLQGDYNAPGGVLTAPGTVAAAIAADAVTLLSDDWSDINSFIYPWDDGGRPGAPTAYRVAIIAGKSIPFKQPAGTGVDYGTDGGVHNFLRFLENWAPPTNKGYPATALVATGQQTLFYEGSMVSFYYNRQAVGLYKGSAATYSPPNRQYTFDNNFTLGPQWLPPKTPTLRSINTTGFTQMLMPTQ